MSLYFLKHKVPQNIETVKGRGIPNQATKAYGGIRSIAPFILNVVTRWK